MELLNQALDPCLSAWKFSNWKLLILIWNRKKVPDGILEVETLHILLSLLSLSSHLSLAYPTQRLNLAQPGRSLEHAPALDVFAGVIQRADICPSATSACPGSQIFPWEKLFVLLITSWSLKPNKMKCVFFFFFPTSLTKRWVPWVRVRSVVRERAACM